MTKTIKKFPELVVGDIFPDVIVCGDPDRVIIIGEQMDDYVEVAKSREYRVINGHYKGKEITVASHGVGASGAATCFEKLIQIGAKKMIRIGTAGSYNESNPPGTLLIADSAAREEGISHQLVPSGMPAVADFDLIVALKKSIEATEFDYSIGTIVTLDVFFEGVIPFPHKEYKMSGALGAEMELAALFVIARMRGVKAAGIVALDGYADRDLVGHNPNKDFVHKAVDAAIGITLEAFINE